VAPPFGTDRPASKTGLQTLEGPVLREYPRNAKIRDPADVLHLDDGMTHGPDLGTLGPAPGGRETH
jgi:hypothetical protein